MPRLGQGTRPRLRAQGAADGVDGDQDGDDFVVDGAQAGERAVEGGSQGSRDAGQEEPFMRRSLFIALPLIACGALYMSGWNIQKHLMPEKPGLLFFFLRLGLVLTILAVCRWYCLWRKQESSLISDTGRESLLIYVLHLQILYRTLGEQALVKRYNGQLNLGQCLLVTALLVAAMLPIAKLWGLLKRRSSKAARLVMALVSLACIAAFFLAK